MRRPLTIWASGISVGAGVYAALDKRYTGWTFSEAVRPWAREHPVIFTASCVAVPVWFWWHILK